MLVCWDTHRDTRNGRGLSFWNNISSYCYYTLYPRQPPRPPTLPPPPRCMMMIWKHDTNTQSLPHHDSEISCFSINKKRKDYYLHILIIHIYKQKGQFLSTFLSHLPRWIYYFRHFLFVFVSFFIFIFASMFNTPVLVLTSRWLSIFCFALYIKSHALHGNKR